MKPYKNIKKERENMWVCVCVQRESMCVCKERACVCAKREHVCVCTERKRERV